MTDDRRRCVVLDNVEELHSSQTVGEPIVEARGVTKVYQTGRVHVNALTAVDLTVTLVAIAAGTALGLIVSFNVITDAAQLPSWDNLQFIVPWATLALIFFVVYAAAWSPPGPRLAAQRASIRLKPCATSSSSQARIRRPEIMSVEIAM